MQGLQIGYFGEFVFMNEYNDPFTIEGAEITDMDQCRVWISDLEGKVYNVLKKDVRYFEPSEKPEI